MARYEITISIKPVDGEYGEMEKATFKGTKQRMQLIFTGIYNSLLVRPNITKKREVHDGTN